jgi:[citrate (pro-3S)-lyase] ligase
MWDEFVEQAVNLDHAKEVQAIRAFLLPFDLSFDESKVDYTVALYQQDNLVATGSLSGSVLRNIAINESLQGEGLTGKIVTHLLNVAAQRGYYHTFLFTKPKNVHFFTQLGFTLLSQVKHAALLETGLPSISHYQQELRNQTVSLPSGQRAVLVMNCNPFTKGHQALIEKAAQENDAVIVLVVSEDQSAFPFAVRYRLVQLGTKHLSNVKVLPSGSYTVSQATFPGYFTHGLDTIIAQTELDATLFAQHIASVLGASVRYLGEEPYSPTTQAYNEALLRILPQYGVKVKIVPRVTVQEEVISASKVRDLLSSQSIESVKPFVPVATYEFLQSSEAQQIIENIKKIKQSN